MVEVEQLLKREGTDWVTPDIPSPIIADINCSPSLARYKHELIEGARVQYELGVLRQRRIKQYTDQIEYSYMEGIGRRVASFDPEIFYRLELVWGRGWWRDRKTLHRILEENPFLAVRCVPRKLTLRVNGLRKEPSAIRGSPGHATQTRDDATRVQGRSCGTVSAPVKTGRCFGNETASGPRIPDVRKIVCA